jgi:Icc-related predicted phosphoesterase
MKRPLRILGLADLHDHWEILGRLKDINADLIAFCGDLHNGSNLEDARPTVKALASLSLPVLIVPGNMDHKDVVPELWRKAGFVMLHRSSLIKGDFGFLGLGGMVAKDHLRIGDPARYYHSDEDVYRNLAEAYPEISGTKYKIIITHQPPRGLRDTLYNGESSGCASLRRFVDDYQPQILLCGHIHEDRGEASSGFTRILNVGELGRGYAALIELGEVTKVEWIDLAIEGT